MSLERWTGRLSPSTAKNNLRWFKNFQKWMEVHGREFSGMCPDEWVEFQRNCTNGERYELLDKVQEYILSLNKLRYNTKRNYYNTIRSFFKHNRAALPEDDFRIRSDVPKVQGKLTVEILRDLINVLKPNYRAAFLCMFQSAMGGEEFEYWNLNGYEDLKEQLSRVSNFIRVNLQGRKSSRNLRNYYTFIGGDAKKALSDYLRVRPVGGTAIFLNQFGEPIKKREIWNQMNYHLIKMGHIKKGEKGDTSNRYGYNPHEMRDLFRTQWEYSPAKGIVAEFMMGHIVDPLGYNKAMMNENFVLNELILATPYLNIISSNLAHGKTDIKALDELREEVETDKSLLEELQKEINRLKTEMESNKRAAHYYWDKDQKESFELTRKLIKENREMEKELEKIQSEETFEYG